MKYSKYSVVANHVDAIPFAGCMVWNGAVTTAGYGVLRRRDQAGQLKTVYAHRLSWEQTHGAIPSDQCVLHHCDVRCCVNPAHLFLGSKKDNTRDMVRKGRDKLFKPGGCSPRWRKNHG